MDTELDRFRRAIGDRVKADENILVGNGELKNIQLRHGNVWDETVFLDDVLQLDTTYSVQSQPGIIVFNTAPDDAVEIRVLFSYAAYTDTEANVLIDTYGIEEAIPMALQEIMVDSARLRDYKEADSEVKNSQVFDHLSKVYDLYMKTKNSANSITSGTRINEQYQSDTTTPPDLSRLT